MFKENISSRIGYTLLGNGFRAIISFVTSMFVARELAPEDYGRYVFLISSFIALRQIFDLSSSSAFFTFLSQKNRSQKFIKAYWYYVALQLAVPFVAIGILIPNDLLQIIWKNESKSLILLALFACFFQSTVWPITVQMAESIRKTFIVQIINVLLVFLHFLTVILICFFDTFAISCIFFVIAVEWSIASLLLFNIYRRNHLEPNLNETKNETFRSIYKKFWVYCMPFLPYTILGFINDFGEKWMLQTWAGSIEQAYFGVANQFASVALLITVSFIKVFWKEVAEAHKNEDLTLVKKLYKDSTRLLFFIGLLISIPLLPWAEDILFIILGDSYTGGSIVFAIMILYPIHQSIGMINGTMFYATERTKPYVIGNIIFILMSIISTVVVLAPHDFIIRGFRLGATGLALKLVLLQYIQVAGFSWYLAKKYDWNNDLVSQAILKGISFLFIYLAYITIEHLDINNIFLEITLTTLLFLVFMAGIVIISPEKIGLKKELVDNKLQALKNLIK